MKNKLNLSFFIIILLTIWAFIYIFPWNSVWVDMFKTKDYKLWLDLQWWIELDYKILFDEAVKDPSFDNQRKKSIIEWLKSIIDKRVEKLNINDSIINSSSYAWEEHIIVQIPMKGNNSFENQENINKAKETIWKVVKIEFKERRKTVSEADKAERKDLAKTILNELKETKDPFNSIAQKYKDNYENVDFWTFSWTKDQLDDLFVIDYSKINKWLYNETISWTWRSSFQLDDSWNISTISWAEWYYVLEYLWNEQITQTWSTTSWSWETSSWKLETVHSFNFVFLTSAPSDWMPAMDKKWRILNDKYFVTSWVQYNELYKPMVELTFNTEWWEIFRELTERLKWEQIAIFVWWNMLTAPRVDEVIPSWKAVITWDYTIEEAKALSQDINTWVVPAPIYLTSEKTIDSRLWAHSLTKLINSWIIGYLLILWFLVFIYRASWFMAWLALFIYIVLLLLIVKVTWTVLTLASIAGLILSIWMAIDANILIFERTKEELRHWKSINEALKTWLKTSFTAIWDTHLTWIITAVILFIFGINMIKWFWLMLWLWLIVSLFTVMVISREFILWLAQFNISKKFFIWKH